MKSAAFLLACSFPLLAQQPAAQPPRPRPITVHFYTETDPPGGSINGWSMNRSPESDGTVFHVRVYSASLGGSWGCDVLFQPQKEDGVYLLRFRPLSAATGATKATTLPAPQRIKAGEIIAIDLMTDPQSGVRLVGYLQLVPNLSIRPLQAAVKKMSDSELRAFESQLNDKLQALHDEVRSVPMGPKQPVVLLATGPPTTVSGPARAFSSSDAEIQLAAPRVHTGSSAEDLSSPESVNGALPWFYLPGRGRFILSLVPRSGFLRSGEIEGRALSVKDGEDTITLQSATFMVSEFGTYFLYIRHDQTWRPEPGKASELQLGALSPEEIKNLR